MAQCGPYTIDDNEFRLIIGRTKIEYDPEKDEINRRRHRYSLSCAQDVFSDLLLPGIPWVFRHSPANAKGEVRHQHLLEYQEEVVHIVTTMRPDETVRIISMRKAHSSEREIFYSLVRTSERPRIREDFIAPPNQRMQRTREQRA